MPVARHLLLMLPSWLLLFAGSAVAQPKGKVEYFSTEQGLSHQRVTTMLKDREGFMWFGTWDGINRFDGKSFISYKSLPGDSSVLGNDRIDQIVEDQHHHLWLCAYDREVYRFNKQTGRFISLGSILHSKKSAFNRIFRASNGLVWIESVDKGLYAVPQKETDAARMLHFHNAATPSYRLPSNKINFFHEDTDKRIWVGTNTGLVCLNREKEGSYRVDAEINALFGVYDFTAVAEDSHHLFFTTANGTVVRFSKNKKTLQTRRIDDSRLNAIIKSRRTEDLYITSSGGNLIRIPTDLNTPSFSKYQEELLTLFEDSKGNIWIEPQHAGALRFDNATSSLRYFSQKNEEGFNYIGNRFRVLEDNNGTVWISMKRGGFGYYNSATGSIETAIKTPDASPYQLPRLIYTINYDPSGILWFTTYERELVKLILQSNDFRQQLLVEKAFAISDNEVRGMLVDRHNRHWVGTKSGKIHVFENGKKINSLFDNEPAGGLGLVYSMLEDSRGNIWFGTKGNGIYKAVPNNQELSRYHLTHFITDKNDPLALHGNEIYALLEDTPGKIWVGSFDNGLSIVEDNDSGTKFINSGPALKNYPRGNFQKIRHLVKDAKNNIWAGTTDGLLLINPGNEHTYSGFSKIPGDIQSLGNNDVQFIYRDAKNSMWLGTSGGGFSHASVDKDNTIRFRNYTTKDGMPNDYVLSCAEDNAGDLWIATENGLTRFDPAKKIFRNYDSYDGLPKASFSEASVCKSISNGQLFFGTTKGFLSLDPRQLTNNPVSAEIALTNLQINNQDAGPRGNESVLKSEINYSPALQLRYDENTLSIDYAILDHRAGNKQAFAYRLIGFDSTWHDDRQLRRATYTNLRPGNYLFEVKSLNADLYSNKPFKKLAFTISPPPWKTGWTYLLYAIAIAILFYFVRRNTIAMIRLRNKIVVEQKLAALKLNFFTNVSHELRTPLTLIVNPLDQVAKRESLSEEGLGYIEVARKNANRMVRFVNQLLDLRKIQSAKASLRVSRVEVISFVTKISDHFLEAARSKRIILDITADQKDIHAWFDAEKIDVVVYNLIGNAMKFTPEGRSIVIHLGTAGESFSVSVIDQGPGVPSDKLEEIFELFHEGSGGTSESKGSGIGLALCKELIDLHGGEITAKQNEFGGLTVSFQLKLGSAHFKKDEVSFVDLPRTQPLEHSSIVQQLFPHPIYSEQISHGEETPLVLLVEDNDELRYFIARQLGEHYKVQMAVNGEEGLEKAIQLVPDLIVSDIMMPVMDGIQMLDQVKKHANTSHVPVVLLSARYSIESQLEGLQYGADCYVTKPFNNEFLLASIENLIRQRKRLFELLVTKKTSVELAPEPITVTSRDEIFLKEVIRVVETGMAETDFNIETVSETMAMSRSTFYKKFKSLTGITPVDFVRDMRLQRAKQYLDKGGTNVSEVAYLVGFSSPKYFSTCFREKYHMSPSDYQKAKAEL